MTNRKPALYLDFHLEMFPDDSTIYFINNSIDTRSPFKFKSFFVFIHPTKTEIVFSLSQNLKSNTNKMIKDTLIAKKIWKQGLLEYCAFWEKHFLH